MRKKLSPKEVESELTFIQKNMEFEGINVSKESLQRCRAILENTLTPEEAMKNIKKKYGLIK